MCVGSACTHPSYNDKNPPSVFFLNLLSQIRPFWDSCQNDVVLYRPLPQELIEGRLTLDPPWVSCKLFVRHCVDSGAGEDKISQIKRLKCFVVGCNHEYSSHHLLPTLSRWRRRGLTLLSFWRECTDSNLPKCVYVRGNYLWSSLTYGRSEYNVFYETLQITFPNNVLVSQFRSWSKQYCSSLHGREGRGQQHGLKNSLQKTELILTG